MDRNIPRLVYHVYPLGACGAPQANDFSGPPVSRLLRLLDWIPHIRSLGCDTLYLGPVFESDFHGYDTADYLTIDRRLGTNDDLKLLSLRLSDTGIGLVLDTVFNHTGRNFWAFKDLQLNQENSVYRNWFCGLDFSRESSYGDPFYYEGWYDAYNLVRLNLANPEVQAYLLDVVDHWVGEFKINGLRLDVAEIMDRDFLVLLSAHCRKNHPGLWLLGEMITGNYRELANPVMLDATTNYEMYKSLHSSHNVADLLELAHTLERQSGKPGVYCDLMLCTFADNHDTTRIASLLRCAEHLRTIYALLFTLPGIPALYYGSEWGITGIKGKHDDLDLRPEVTYLPELAGSELYDWIRELAGWRGKLPALRYGEYRTLLAAQEQLVFWRSLDAEWVIVAVNISNATVGLPLPPEGCPENLTDLLTGDTLAAAGALMIELPPYWVRLLVRAEG